MKQANPEQVEQIRKEAIALVAKADALGVKLRINQVSEKPLAMGNTQAEVEAWPSRRGVPEIAQ